MSPEGHQDRAAYKQVLLNLVVPKYAPKQGVKIAANDSEAQAQQSAGDGKLTYVLSGGFLRSCSILLNTSPVKYFFSRSKTLMKSKRLFNPSLRLQIFREYA